MGSSPTPHQSICMFQGAKAESGILKVDTKKDLEGIFVARCCLPRRQRPNPTGERNRRLFFFPNPPGKKKTGRIFGNDDLICGTFGICFYVFKRCLKNQPNQQNGWLFSNCSWKGIFFVAVFWGAKF